MIRGYREKRTARFAGGERVKEFEAFARVARKRLLLLDAANSLVAIAGVPGNRLKALKKDRKGQYSIWINDQWRICLVWNDEDHSAELVEIVDYH